ncbi:hypothetical protein Tco_1363069 [Tanacetum coccineum]
MSSRTLLATRHSLFLLKSLKYLCNSSGIMSRRFQVQTLMSFFLLTRSVYVKVFRKILDICPRVQGVDFTQLPDDETTLTFLLDLGYKGLLHKHPSMYVDHIHQPWRTLDSIINKCLSGKTASNDILRKSRIDILWGMFYRENVDYPELI